MQAINLCYYPFFELCCASAMGWELHPDRISHLIHSGIYTLCCCYHINTLYISLVSVYQIGWCCQSCCIIFLSYIVPVYYPLCSGSNSLDGIMRYVYPFSENIWENQNFMWMPQSSANSEKISPQNAVPLSESSLTSSPLL